MTATTRNVKNAGGGPGRRALSGRDGAVGIRRGGAGVEPLIDTFPRAIEPSVNYRHAVRAGESKSSPRLTIVANAAVRYGCDVPPAKSAES